MKFPWVHNARAKDLEVKIYHGNRDVIFLIFFNADHGYHLCKINEGRSMNLFTSIKKCLYIYI